MTAILWHSAALTSFEYFELAAVPRGHALRGIVLARLDGEPAEIVYEILCDSHWRTRRVGISQTWGGEVMTLSLHADTHHHWTAAKMPLHDLDGLIDIDLAITPSTNLLPLKRHPLAVGEALETVGAWVQFPSLAITPLAQQYTRISETDYDYAAPALGYSARHTFDADSVCVTYGDLWKRV